MVLRGETPQASWRPFIKELDLSDERDSATCRRVRPERADGLISTTRGERRVAAVRPERADGALSWEHAGERRVAISGLSALTVLYLETRR